VNLGSATDILCPALPEDFFFQVGHSVLELAVLHGAQLRLDSHPILPRASLTPTPRCFTNTIAAYEALPEATKRRLVGLKAIHRYSERKRVANSPRPKLTKKQLDETPDVAHPIVRTHAWTGRKSLYVTAVSVLELKAYCTMRASP
jgi:hypothetical protein